MLQKNIPASVFVQTISKITAGHRGSALVQAQKISARSLLKRQIQENSIVLPEIFPKAENGCPLPFNGIHWSISHKPECVAAMISSYPCGVDIEVVCPRKKELLQYVAPFNEWEMAGFTRDSLYCPGNEVWHFFYRFWTAREALLKCIGQGLVLLSKCRVKEIFDNECIIMELEEIEARKLGFPSLWYIFQKTFYDESCKKNIIISWTTPCTAKKSDFLLRIEKK